jgi:DNA-binding IclR family transcriptional regulator
MPATTVDKALDVLFHLLAEPAPVGVSSLGRSLGLPKASAHRLLASLQRRDLVEQDASGRYRPGFGLVALGLGVLDREPLVAVARPILEAESAQLGETSFLVAPRAGFLTVLDKVEGTGFLRAAPRVGEKVPVHATAVGKLFLGEDSALLPAERTLERFTALTPRSRKELFRATRLVAEQGWAHNRDEWIEGLSVVAAPVSSRGNLVAAVAMAMSTHRMDTLGPEAVAERAMAAAARIGRRLEGRGE